MKKTISYILILFFISCAIKKQSGKDLLKNNKDIEIVNVLVVNENDSLYFNELRLHLSSALYTKKFMFKKYGHWDEAIKINKYQNYLIWNECKLFEGKDDLFTVVTSGVESRDEMYSSIIIQNKDNFDLLADNSKLRDTLISMFHYGIKKTTLSKDKFYREYWKMRNRNK